MKFLIQLLVMVLAFGISNAQNFQLKSYVIGSSSQSTENSSFKVKSTLGQPAIGLVQNQSNIVGSGFWYSIGQAPAPMNSQIISLNSGWNIISSFMVSSNPSMESIWNDIVNQVVLVKNSGGFTFIPAYGINQIGNWNVESGYQVYMSSNQSLEISGTAVVPENTDITLPQGWSIVSYLRNSPLSVVTSFETLTDDEALVLAKNSGGFTYIPQYGINQIGNLIPGQGYQIYLSKSSTLTYPANFNGKLTGKEYETALPKKLLPEHTSTGSSMVLLLFTNASDGIELGAYNQNGLLIGSGVIYDNKASITIWGNNQYNDYIDGAIENEYITIKSLDNNTSQMKEIILSEIKSVVNDDILNYLAYRNNAFLMAKAIVESDNLDVYDISLSPNPFSNEIGINMNLVRASKLKISLFDLDGALIAILKDSDSEVGAQDIRYNSQNLASGEYNLLIEIGNERILKKIIKIK